MSTKPKRVYPKNMPLRQPPKREFKMRQIVKQLQITPITEIACKQACVSRATYYRWRANDFIFARAADHALEAGRFSINDMAESQLIRKIKNSDGSAIRYWLSHNHPRYARTSIQQYSQICETKSTEEEYREKRRSLRNIEIVFKDLFEKGAIGEVDDRLEQDAYKTEDWMFERFEMLNDDTEMDDEKVENNENHASKEDTTLNNESP